MHGANIEAVKVETEKNTGKYLLEALIFASINLQYEKRMFMELP